MLALPSVQVDFALDLALAGRCDATRRLRGGPRLTTEWRGELGIVRIHNSLGDVGLIGEFRRALQTLAGVGAIVVDLRDTPSGGTTTVARALMSPFVDRLRPYQVHVVPSEQRLHGSLRLFVEYVQPTCLRWEGEVHVVGGRWTGSMGEGLMVGCDAICFTTVGSRLGGLPGALDNVDLERSGARVDLGLEQLFHVDGTPREAFVPQTLRSTRSTACGPTVRCCGPHRRPRWVLSAAQRCRPPVRATCVDGRHRALGV